MPRHYKINKKSYFRFTDNVLAAAAGGRKKRKAGYRDESGRELDHDLRVEIGAKEIHQTSWQTQHM